MYYISEETREEMRAILDEIQTGEFARVSILESIAVRPVYRALKKINNEHIIEKVGKQLQSMMG
jgi:ketol-acid reductoisomerase